jgi:hypothetical protein
MQFFFIKICIIDINLLKEKMTEKPGRNVKLLIAMKLHFKSEIILTYNTAAIDYSINFYF